MGRRERKPLQDPLPGPPGSPQMRPGGAAALPEGLRLGLVGGFLPTALG